MRYLRHYPKFLQTILLMLLIFTLASFSFLLAHVGVTKIFGEQLDSISSLGTINIIHAAQFVQALTSLFTFMLSALLFAYLTHPNPGEYLGLRKPTNYTFTFLVIISILLAVPIFAQIGEWMKLIDFGAGARSSFAEQEKMVKVMMGGTGLSDLFLYLLLFAALPAVGEELLFRGVVMRFAFNSGQNIHFAILFSAAIFSLAHGSVYNFLPIMLAGVLLGYIYYLGSSLWVCIIAHFINNSIAVILLFLGNRKIIPMETVEHSTLPWFGLILILALLFWVFKLMIKNSSPLPQDWNDDFKEEAHFKPNN
jgi:membrane protease YdiL (CAAX protease family)